MLAQPTVCCKVVKVSFPLPSAFMRNCFSDGCSAVVNVGVDAQVDLIFVIVAFVKLSRLCTGLIYAHFDDETK
jgi:hypothetical protein